MVAAYAPTSSASMPEREEFRKRLTMLLENSPGKNMCLVGGDFNAEVGPGKDRDHRDVLGAYGNNKRSVTGEELIDFCRREGLVVANSYFRQKHPGTWRHVRYGTEHVLDMFLVPRRQKNEITDCKTVHFWTREEEREANKKTIATRR